MYSGPLISSGWWNTGSYGGMDTSLWGTQKIHNFVS